MKSLFNTSFGVKLDASGVARAMVDFMEQEKKFFYKVIIGSDSLRLSDNNADFVTAIVVHRVGNGGRYFWRRLELQKFYTLRDRIINEVVMSLEAAQKILQELKSLGATNFDFEIHADIGENGETKAMLQEVTGMIRAYNFEVKTKPDSYAASKVADRHV